MNAIVVGHVPVAELPLAWRERLANSESARVTVRIEAEAPVSAANDGFTTNDPAFGIWRDHQDATDVAAYVRATNPPIWSRRFSRLNARSGFESVHYVVA